MPRRRNGLAPLGGRGRERVSRASLERQRQLLQQRMDRLGCAAKASSGYKSARILLGSKYLRAGVSARAAILRAANFLISVLEMLAPF